METRTDKIIVATNRAPHSAKEKLKFKETIIEITNDNECKINNLVYDKQEEEEEAVDDGEITDSELQLRDELDQLNDNEEALKKRIYKQALNINQSSQISPKFQRIHEGVSRVFGLDDPPPGFGLIYPKYYYLEQKRPQPMSPLKVWRGFNGNIYFEPIHLQNINTESNALSTTLNFNRQHSYAHHNSLTKSNLRIDTNERLLSNSKYLDETIENNEPSLKIDIKSKDNTAILLEEASEILLANTLNKRSQTFFQVKNELDTDLDTMSSVSFKDRKLTKMNSLVLKRQETQREHAKLRINTENPNRILPNLNAVKRHNVPLRGLAFREAKYRIGSSNDNENEKVQDTTITTQSTNIGVSYGDYFQNKKSTPEEIFRNSNSTANSSYIRADSPHKVNYRDMLKGIRKGVTINLNNSVINSRRDRYNFNIKVDDEKKMSLNDTNQLQALEKKSKTALITHRNFKILNIKGDRISNIDILVPSKPSRAIDQLNQSLHNINNQSVISNHNIASILNEKSRTDMNPNKINKIVIKAKVQSPSMMSLKSNLSLVSVQQANRRTNPSPEIT